MYLFGLQTIEVERELQTKMENVEKIKKCRGKWESENSTVGINYREVKDRRQNITFPVFVSLWQLEYYPCQMFSDYPEISNRSAFSAMHSNNLQWLCQLCVDSQYLLFFCVWRETGGMQRNGMGDICNIERFYLHQRN